MLSSSGIIDPDDRETWPEQTFRWADAKATALRGSTAHLADLAISPDEETTFRQTFGSHRLLAYHSTRLLAREVQSIRTDGLRLLDHALVEERIAGAVANGSLAGAALQRAKVSNVYALGAEDHRAGRVCFVLGRSAFEEDVGGCGPLLRYWGGEAIRGGPADVPAFEALGVPSIVVATLDLTRRCDDPFSWPDLANLFVGTVLDLPGRIAEVHYPEAVAGRHVLDIWQPGHMEYDRHTLLPR